jgi:uncharacterized SAM-binding protein YcdF (DUF218 family)
VTPPQQARQDPGRRPQEARASVVWSRPVHAPWTRRWRRALIFLLTLVGVAAAAIWAVGQVGPWLVVADALQPAAAIVVCGGGLPFRAMEAATLYQQGWAPQVWVTRGVAPAAEAALARLGVPVIEEVQYTRQVLERLAVPTAAIRLLPEGVQNTVEEVQLIERELRQHGAAQVILVTSRPHTRRVRATWRALVGDTPVAVVRFAQDEPYAAARWWRHRVEALAVSRELFGLLNVWAGFPLR